MNTGPARKSSSPPRRIIVPVRSEGSMSGVNWARLNCESQSLCDGARQQRLGDPGRALDQHVAAASDRGDDLLERLVLADHDRRHLLAHPLVDLSIAASSRDRRATPGASASQGPWSARASRRARRRRRCAAAGCRRPAARRVRSDGRARAPTRSAPGTARRTPPSRRSGSLPGRWRLPNPCTASANTTGRRAPPARFSASCALSSAASSRFSSGDGSASRSTVPRPTRRTSRSVPRLVVSAAVSPSPGPVPAVGAQPASAAVRTVLTPRTSGVDAAG